MTMRVVQKLLLVLCVFAFACIQAAEDAQSAQSTLRMDESEESSLPLSNRDLFVLDNPLAPSWTFKYHESAVVEAKGKGKVAQESSYWSRSAHPDKQQWLHKGQQSKENSVPKMWKGKGKGGMWKGGRLKGGMWKGGMWKGMWRGSKTVGKWKKKKHWKKKKQPWKKGKGGKGKGGKGKGAAWKPVTKGKGKGANFPTPPVTSAPTFSPSTVAPTGPVTLPPTRSPVIATNLPTRAPVIPTDLPTRSPLLPQVQPTLPPTVSPTVLPSSIPSQNPSFVPSSLPSSQPSPQ